jgi:hypothetical protein
MKSLIALFLVFSFSASAQVSEQEVNEMLEQMVKGNVISKEEAEKTRVRMVAMSSSDWQQVNEKASKIAARHPASTGTGAEATSIGDLDEAQLDAIQNDLEKIAPHYSP